MQDLLKLDLFHKVQKVIQTQLSIPLESIVPEANLINDLGADSLDSVELMMAFEEAFEIDIADELAETISTVQDLIDLVSTHTNKAAHA